jgi:UPF0755 protein
LTKKSSVFGISISIFIFTLVVVTMFFGWELFKKSVSQDKTEIVFEVAPGASLAQISRQLQDRRLIRNAKSFQYYAQFRGQASKFKTGEYSLNQTMTPDEIMAVLVSGKSIARSITVAEGLNIFDIAQIFEKAGIATTDEFYEIVHDKELIQQLLEENLPGLEGYLYPETYLFTKYEDARSIVTQMVKRFLSVWNEDVATQARALGWTRHQIVTFASIVEKETGAAFERPLVSSVFHNRLQKKMRLQTDPTVLYGLAVQQKKMPNNITKQDLLTPTPYNTYTNFGLPPAPIANPGKEALLATLNPQQSKYLFFVSKNDGTHIFSENLQQHNKAVQQFQLNAKARENKSWRDLKEKKANQ